MPASAQQPRHPSLYLLGDHLDAALAMGEDLLTERVALANATQHLTMARLVRQNRELAEFLTTVRTLELSLTARLLQARKRAEDMKRRESRLKPLIALFVAGTAPLVDAAAVLGDTASRDFDTGDTASAFLRSRGLIARDAAGLERLSQLSVGEDSKWRGAFASARCSSRRHLPDTPIFCSPSTRTEVGRTARRARTPPQPRRPRDVAVLPGLCGKAPDDNYSQPRAAS